VNWSSEPLWRQVGATVGAFFILGVLFLGCWATVELVFGQGDRLSPAQRVERRAAMAREFNK